MKYLMLCLMAAGLALTGCYAEEGAVKYELKNDGTVILVTSPEEAAEIAEKLEAQQPEKPGMTDEEIKREAEEEILNEYYYYVRPEPSADWARPDHVAGLSWTIEPEVTPIEGAGDAMITLSMHHLDKSLPPTTVKIPVMNDEIDTAIVSYVRKARIRMVENCGFYPRGKIDLPSGVKEFNEQAEWAEHVDGLRQEWSKANQKKYGTIE